MTIHKNRSALITNANGEFAQHLRAIFSHGSVEGKPYPEVDFITAGMNMTGVRYRRIIVLPLWGFQSPTDESNHSQWFFNIYTMLEPQGELIFMSEKDEKWFRKFCEKDHE